MKTSAKCDTSVERLRFTNDSLKCAGIKSCSIDETIREQFKKHHLVSSTKIIKDIFPDIYKVTRNVNRVLAPEFELETYVKNSADFQACCFPGLGNSISVVLNSGLVQLCSMDELHFVVGHEVGHYLFGHHLYPQVNEIHNQVEKLNVLALQRAAEISADRTGFICVEDKESAYKAILKLATGLTDAYISFNLSAYLRQAKELEDMGGNEYSLLDTHPACCTRMRAMLWFEMSDVYYDWVKREGSAPISTADLNKRVSCDLSSASGFRLSKINEKEAKQALFFGVLSLFVSDGVLSKAEQTLLEQNFGKAGMERALDYLRQFGANAVMDKFESILQGIRYVDKEIKQILYDDIVRFSELAGGQLSYRKEVLQRATRLMNFSDE